MVYVLFTPVTKKGGGGAEKVVAMLKVAHTVSCRISYR